MAEKKENKALIIQGRYDLTVPEHTLIKRGLALVDSLIYRETKSELTDAEIDDIIMLFGEKNIDIIDTDMELEIREYIKPGELIVTIMGHVNHGKTSLLEAIRQINVIDGEAGDITTAIRPVHVNINGHNIVFINMPDYKPISDMRGYYFSVADIIAIHKYFLSVADIVVLVIAADDGITNQTIEAINQAKAAGVPIIVAINKIDKPSADPEKIKQSLTEHGLLSEQWGGDTIYCEISAKRQINIEELLEMVSLQADVLGYQKV